MIGPCVICGQPGAYALGWPKDKHRRRYYSACGPQCLEVVHSKIKAKERDA